MEPDRKPGAVTLTGKTRVATRRRPRSGRRGAGGGSPSRVRPRGRGTRSGHASRQRAASLRIGHLHRASAGLRRPSPAAWPRAQPVSLGAAPGAASAVTRHARGACPLGRAPRPAGRTSSPARDSRVQITYRANDHQLCLRWRRPFACYLFRSPPTRPVSIDRSRWRTALCPSRSLSCCFHGAPDPYGGLACRTDSGPADERVRPATER